MRGIGVGVVDGPEASVDDVIDRFKRAEAAGFQSAWIPNIFGFDATTVSALAGRETERIEIGTAAGVTDFHAAIFPHGGDARGAMARTFEFLAELARR